MSQAIKEEVVEGFTAFPPVIGRRSGYTIQVDACSVTQHRKCVKSGFCWYARPTCELDRIRLLKKLRLLLKDFNYPQPLPGGSAEAIKRATAVARYCKRCFERCKPLTIRVQRYRG